jgi:haloalkane dehalogenase
MKMRFTKSLLALALSVALAACGGNGNSSTADNGTTDSGAADSDTTDPGMVACDFEPVILTTDAGIEFVRTPDSCFDSLPGWPYESKYVEIDGLRQAYVDEGPADGPIVLLLHGQPSWSYLYRKMIPVLVEGGYRVIAMDHLGMGRSDKPIDIGSYSYLGHCERLLHFIEALDLTDINLFAQDWGSLIGLRVAGLNPDRFARIAIGDGMLPVIPAGLQPYPPVENPNEVEDIPALFAGIPAQQVPVYDGCERLMEQDGGFFGEWMIYAMKAESFHASEVLEAMTWFDLPPEVEAAYDAPFPSRTYMAGPRVFPSLVNELPGVNDEAWEGLTSSPRPFLTIWATNDPGNLGACETQQLLVDSMPGAEFQPHDRLAEASHFLQDDQGEEIAKRLVKFYADQSSREDESNRGRRYCEILLGYLIDGELQIEVWGTQGLNLCPAESWEALDPDSVQAEYEADIIVWNGPRAGVMDAGTFEIPDGDHRMYGDLEMQLLATITMDPANAAGGAYSEVTVNRTTGFEFWSGFEVYELTSPEGEVYIMQAMAQIVDPELTLADLADLGSSLDLPDGWTYKSYRRITDLVLAVEGEVTVVQDELKNTYMRKIEGTSSQVLPVLDNGTGTPCGDDSDCQDLDASHCLTSGGQGFCTVEGCKSGGCGTPYMCCFDCSAEVAPMLPFEESACVPEGVTSMLTGQAGCTCE